MHLKRLKYIQQLNDISGLVKLVEINELFEENFCSNFYRLSSLFEYCENNLQQEINVRQQVYTRKEIVHFLQQVVGALVELSTRALRHGDLRPSHILLLPNQQYKIKLPDTDQFRKMVIHFEEDYCYLTPD
jgi:serine/threonine protein kinase